MYKEAFSVSVTFGISPSFSPTLHKSGSNCRIPGHLKFYPLPGYAATSLCAVFLFSHLENET